MVNLINQFWVLSRQGLCYFYRSNTKIDVGPDGMSKADQNILMGGFFSAILSFANELASADIEKMQISESKFLIFTEKSLIFVVESPIGVSDKEIKHKMNLIKTTFIKKFSKQLDKFDGDVNQFSSFESELDQLFKKMTLAEEWGNSLSELSL